jgi:Polyketide cyclase / dehydrase and lipid transport
VRRNRDDVSEPGWVSIDNAIEISRPPGDVFDYLTDTTKELEWNPRTRRVEKLTSGPIGPGTRFGAEWIKGNPAIVEYVKFERSTAWTSIARSRCLDAKGEGRISPTEHGSRLVIRTQLRPKGLLALLLPVMRRTMHRREDQNLERVKAILEGRES